MKRDTRLSRPPRLDVGALRDFAELRIGTLIATWLHAWMRHPFREPRLMDQNFNFDKIDRTLLDRLQADCSTPISELAEAVHLSTPACWKRIQRLKQAKVITGQVSLCDPKKLGRGTLVFVFIRAREHSDAWLASFAAAIRQRPEVVAAYRLSGDLDYLVQVQVSDIDGYDQFYRSLIRLVDLGDVSSSFAMERLKFTTAIPSDNAI